MLERMWEPTLGGDKGRQLKVPSGTLGKRPFWAKSWPGAFWKEANFDNLRALGPAIKIPFWDPLETALLGQILAGSLWEPFFGAVFLTL